jgi:hypothetical protein
MTVETTPRTGGRARLDRLAFLPDLFLGLTYLVAWLLPGLVGASAAGWLVLGIELEVMALMGAWLFAISLMAMLDRDSKFLHRLVGAGFILMMIGFVGFQVIRYSFVWPAVALAVLFGNRLLGFISGGFASSDTRGWAAIEAIFALALYVFAVGPTFYLPVPAFGGELGPLPPEHARWCAKPAEFVADFFETPVKGDWCVEPHRALAGGALYFLASAVRDSWVARLRARPPHSYIHTAKP